MTPHSNKSSEPEPDPARAFVSAELSRGESDSQIISKLVANQWNENDARTLVQSVIAGTPAAVSHARLRRAQGRIRAGVFLLVAGLIWTLYTYIVTPNGTVIVAWGAMLLGIIRIASGVTEREKIYSANR